MATMLCKEMGIPMVLAKAKDKLQGTILKKVGADSVVYPEVEMGSRIAMNLVAKDFSDWIELSDDYSMVEVVVPQPWQGKCLAELKIRERFGINVVGMITDNQVDVNIDPQMPLPSGCILIMIGANEILQKFDVKKVCRVEDLILRLQTSAACILFEPKKLSNHLKKELTVYYLM